MKSFFDVVAATHDHQSLARAPSTLRTYEATLSVYKKVLDSASSEFSDAPSAFPITDSSMRFYFSKLQYREPPTPFATISQGVSSFAYYFQRDNLPDLTKESSFRQYILSLKRTHMAGFHPNAKKFISIQQIQTLIDQASYFNAKDVKGICILTMVFFGFLRISELCNLLISDLEYKDSFWQISIKNSKTDKFSYGAILCIDANKTIYSAFFWMTMYYTHFVDQNSSESLFTTPPFEVNRLIHHRMKEIDEPDIAQFSSHSFRKGGAHAAALNGIHDCILQAHGRWKSSCYTIYRSVERKHAGETITKII
jgi:integrase